MGRAKLRMELITKEKTRHTTYLKRKQGIVKKATEFSILCDVDTIIVIYPPNSNEPEIWPEDSQKFKKTIASFKSKKGESGKKTYDLNDFFQDRKKKIEEELVKARKKNMEAKYSTWFDELDGLNEGQLRHFVMALENKESIVRAHLELMKNKNMKIQLPFMFEDKNQPMVHYAGMGMGLGLGSHYGSGSGSCSHPSLDRVQVVNHNQQFVNQHDLGWLNDATNSFVPMKHEPMMGYGYPVFDGNMVYDNTNQWAFQPPVVHGGMLPEFVMQEVGSQMNNGVGDFVMNGHHGRFVGN